MTPGEIQGTNMPYELGFIGAGNMAEAIARGALRQGLLKAEQMVAADPVEARRAVFGTMGIACVDNAAVIRGSRHVLLAVKPQSLPELKGELRMLNAQQQVLISIMAGVRIEKIEAMVGKPTRVVRVMPNLAMQVGYGMSGIAAGPHAQPADAHFVARLMGSAGQTIEVEESLLDAVTAVSGSGPGYLFYFAEALERAARELGLGEHARLLVRQTLAGAGRLLEESGLSPGELRARVTSKGGTTHAGLSHMEAQGVGQAIVEAVKAAERRSRELG